MAIGLSRHFRLGKIPWLGEFCIVSLKHSPYTTARLLLTGLAISFFGLLFLTASIYPGQYDWRYRVISSLASPKDNPHFHGVASLGLAWTGVFLWMFADCLLAATRAATPRLAIRASRLQKAGAMWLILAALISSQDRWLGRPRLHEDLAELAGLFLGLAFVLWTWGLVTRPATTKRYGLKIMLVLLTLLPLGGLLLSRAALFIAYLRDSRADYEQFKHSLFCSLAFWEWSGAVCLYLFLVVATFLLKGRTPL